MATPSALHIALSNGYYLANLFLATIERRSVHNAGGCSAQRLTINTVTQAVCRKSLRLPEGGEGGDVSVVLRKCV
jgi:hypothetical protein